MSVCVYVCMRACTCGHHRAFKSKRDLTGSTTERADEIYREKGEGGRGERFTLTCRTRLYKSEKQREARKRKREKKKKSKRKESDTSESDT